MNLSNSITVSVIVPIYNGEMFVKECCAQLAAQTLDHMEIILVNDGSSDQTGSLCDQMASTYSNCSVIHQANKGVSVARNAGIEYASGEYIGFVDVDDGFEPDMFDVLYHQAKAHDLDVLGMEAIGAEGELSVFRNKETLLQLFLDKKISISVWNKIYKRSLYPSFRFPDGVKIYEDCSAVYKSILSCHTFGAINIRKYHYVHRENSSCRIPEFSEKFFDAIRVVDEICGTVEREYPSLVKYSQKRKATTYLRISKIYYLRKHPRKYRDRILALREWLRQLSIAEWMFCFKKFDRIRYILFRYAFPIFLLCLKTVDKE